MGLLKDSCKVLLIGLLFQQVLSGQTPVKIMPLGNSITYGNYHPELRDSGLITGYRQPLWLMLTEAGYTVDFVGNITAGEDAIPAFDPHNEGHSGWTDYQIADNIYNWLLTTDPEVILLEIGTNDINPSPNDVQTIFNEIDRYENDYDKQITIVMAKIINRASFLDMTTHYNFNIEKMAWDRINTLGDDIVIIDMEFEAGLNYVLTESGGDMNDNLHPNVSGHTKMAVRWFKALEDVLPAPTQKPRITSVPNPFGISGINYSYHIVATNTPEFSLLIGPAGMTIDSESGTINWLPGSTGTFPVEILAENAFGTDTQQYNLVIKENTSRIRDGLLALYDFTEQGGNMVHDVSGVGEPLDLYISNTDYVVWDSVQGLEIISDAIIACSGLARKITDPCKLTNEISVGFWLRTGKIQQSNSSDIFTISDPITTGLTFSQNHVSADTCKYYYSNRLRTSSTTDQGIPALILDERFHEIMLHHIVYTRKSDGAEKIYINGEEVESGTRAGNFSQWASTFKLTMGNNYSLERPWLGKLYLAAVYNSALSASQVLQNYNAGYNENTFNLSLPDAPTNALGSPLTSIAAEITWEDNSDDETGFIVERKGTNGYFIHICYVPKDSTRYIDASLASNSTYTYRIKTINDYGESEYSNETTLTTFDGSYLSNVSRYKSAHQISTIYGGVAGRAVDGNTNGAYSGNSVTHTDYEMNAWWQVDLGAVYNISHIEVWNRTDVCCKDRLANYYVFISEDPFDSYDLATILNQEGVWRGYEPEFPDPSTVYHAARRGRYMRLQLNQAQEICLAELIARGSLHLSQPVFTSSPLTEINQDQNYSYTMIATDADGDRIVYSVPDKPLWLAFNPDTRILSGIPSNSDTGTHQITARIYDGLYTVDQSFTILVHNVNDPPVITSMPIVEIDQDQNYCYTLTADDIDGDDLEYSALLKPDWLSFDPETGILNGIPSNNDVGQHNITLRVHDGTVNTDQLFTIQVHNVNDPPVITSVPVVDIDENQYYGYTVTALDIDGDDLEYSACVIPDWLSFDPGMQLLSGIPSDNDVGQHDVTLRVFDGTANTDHSFTIQVHNVNDPPVITSVPDSTADDYELYTYRIDAFDPDDDPIAYFVVTLPAWLSYDTIEHTLSGIPEWDHANKLYDVFVRVGDGMYHTEQAWTIEVTNRNDLPVWITTPITTVEVNAEYLYQFRATDNDEDDTLEYSPVSVPDWLNFSSDAIEGTLSGIPLSEDVGISNIGISVYDGHEYVVQNWDITVTWPEFLFEVPEGNILPYPNPASDFVYLRFSGRGDYILYVYDITGNVMDNIKSESYNGLIRIDMHTLHDGIYIVKMILHDRNYYSRFVVKK